MKGSGEEFKSKREQFTNQIRRQNREQILQKRRNIQKKSEQGGQKATSSTQHIIDSRFGVKIKQFHQIPVSLQNFMQYLTGVHSVDIVDQHFGVICIRKLLTSKNHPPIQQVIDAGLVPKLIQLAKQSEYPQLQLQAIWCLTNVAAGNSMQTGSIIDKGGIKIFVDLLLSQHVGIVEQAVWALGNIASDIPAYRDAIVKAGGVTNINTVIQVAVKEMAKTPDMQQIIQSSVWTLSAICRTKPLPNYMLIKDALPVFFYVITNDLLKTKQIMGNVCWAMSYYTDKKRQGPQKIDKIQNCINSGVLPKLLTFLDHSYDSLVVAAFKVLGNIATGTIDQSKYLISIGIVPKLDQMINKTKKIYRKQACWVLSNLAAGSPEQIQAIFSRQSLVQMLIQLLQKDLPDVRSQICYIFANAIQEGQANKMSKFITQINLIKHVAQIITISTDVQELYASLQCLDTILHLGKQINSTSNQGTGNFFVKQLYKLKLVPKLQQLQHHEQDKIYQQVAKIVSTYFQLEDPLKL